MNDDVADLDAHRAHRRRRAPTAITPAPVAPFPGRTVSAPEDAVVLLLVNARLRQTSMSDDDARARLASDIACYALAAGAVLHPWDPATAHAVRDRLLAAVRDGTTDLDSLVRIARGDDPPEAG